MKLTWALFMAAVLCGALLAKGHSYRHGPWVADERKHLREVLFVTERLLCSSLADLTAQEERELERRGFQCNAADPSHDGNAATIPSAESSWRSGSLAGPAPGFLRCVFQSDVVVNEMLYYVVKELSYSRGPIGAQLFKGISYVLDPRYRAARPLTQYVMAASRSWKTNGIEPQKAGEETTVLGQLKNHRQKSIMMFSKLFPSESVTLAEQAQIVLTSVLPPGAGLLFSDVRPHLLFISSASTVEEKKNIVAHEMLHVLVSQAWKTERRLAAHLEGSTQALTGLELGDSQCGLYRSEVEILQEVIIRALSSTLDEVPIFPASSQLEKSFRSYFAANFVDRNTILTAVQEVLKK